jgi:dTDP-4-dehydrorhamnose reductase
VTRAMVTGASGLLGGQVLRALQRSGVAVEGWSHTVQRAPDGIAFHVQDLTLDGAIERAVSESRPDLIVHCAALTDVDRCEAEPEAASALNARLPALLARAAAKRGLRFVHISTDAVYDGERAGRHSEHEDPAPANVYAVTKREGEVAVLAAHPTATVVRTTMHGWTATGRPSFSEAILSGLVHSRPLTLFRDVVFSPLHAGALADAVLALAAVEIRGVINVGAADAIAKDAFGRLIADMFGLDASPITAIDLAERRLAAPRPRNSALDVERLTSLLGSAPPTVRAGVERLRAEALDGTAARLKGRPPGPLNTLLQHPTTTPAGSLT